MKIGFSVATSDVNTPQLPAQQGEFTKSLDTVVNKVAKTG